MAAHRGCRPPRLVTPRQLLVAVVAQRPRLAFLRFVGLGVWLLVRDDDHKDRYTPAVPPAPAHPRALNPAIRTRSAFAALHWMMLVSLNPSTRARAPGRRASFLPGFALVVRRRNRHPGRRSDAGRFPRSERGARPVARRPRLRRPAADRRRPGVAAARPRRGQPAAERRPSHRPGHRRARPRRCGLGGRAWSWSCSASCSGRPSCSSKRSTFRSRPVRGIGSWWWTPAASWPTTTSCSPGR